MNPPKPQGQRICFGETCAPLEFDEVTHKAEVTFAADTSITTLRVYGLIEEFGALVSSEYPPTMPIDSITEEGNVIVITGSAAWTAGTMVSAELLFADSVARDLEITFE